MLFSTAVGTAVLPAASLLALPAALAARCRAGTAAGMPALGPWQSLGGSPRRPVAACLVPRNATRASPLGPVALLAPAADLAAADRLRRALLAP